MPTYTNQPNETDGIDTYINEGATTSNYGTDASLLIGCGPTYITRTLWKNDFTKGTNIPPVGAKIDSVTLTLYLNSEASNRGVNLILYKILRDWVESQATWNIWTTSNNWATAGCANTTTDRENTELASYALGGSEAAGSKVITLNASGIAVVSGWINGTISNYGFLIKTDNEAASTRYEFSSASDGTPANRPLITIVWQPAGMNPAPISPYFML